MQDGVGSSWRTQEIHLDLKPRFESQAVRDSEESPKMEGRTRNLTARNAKRKTGHRITESRRAETE